MYIKNIKRRASYGSNKDWKIYSRKEKSLTQSDLAEKLNVTDRTISKWENGICLPDVGTMPELCNILNIPINDLFSGEVVDMKNSTKKLEENLLEMTKLKEEKDKQLLQLEWIIGILGIIQWFLLIYISNIIIASDWIKVLLVVIGCVIFLIAMVFGLKIEQVAGYYECKECHNKYVPKYMSVFLAPHMGRTRYMKCPKCKKWSYHKKVLK